MAEAILKEINSPGGITVQDFKSHYKSMKQKRNSISGWGRCDNPGNRIAQPEIITMD